MKPQITFEIENKAFLDHLEAKHYENMSRIDMIIYMVTNGNFDSAKIMSYINEFMQYSTEYSIVKAEFEENYVLSRIPDGFITKRLKSDDIGEDLVELFNILEVLSYSRVAHMDIISNLISSGVDQSSDVFQTINNEYIKINKEYIKIKDEEISPNIIKYIPDDGNIYNWTYLFYSGNLIFTAEGKTLPGWTVDFNTATVRMDKI